MLDYYEGLKRLDKAKQKSSATSTTSNQSRKTSLSPLFENTNSGLSERTKRMSRETSTLSFGSNTPIITVNPANSTSIPATSNAIGKPDPSATMQRARRMSVEGTNSMRTRRASMASGIDYYEGLQKLDTGQEASTVGSTNSNRRNRKTSLAAFFESPSHTDVSNTAKRTRRLSVDNSTMLRNREVSTAAAVFTTLEEEEEEEEEEKHHTLAPVEEVLVPFRSEFVRNNSLVRNPLHSALLRLYLARLSLRRSQGGNDGRDERQPQHKKKRRAVVPGGNWSGGLGAANDQASRSDEAALLHTEDLVLESDSDAELDWASSGDDWEEVTRRLDAEYASLKHKYGSDSPRSMTPPLRGRNAALQAPDLSKVHQKLSAAPSNDFIDMPVPVAEQRRKNRETNLMAPLSF